MTWAIHAVLMGLVLLLGLLAVELKELLYAVLSFGGMCAAIAGLFWLFNAPYSAVFQLLIYAGAIVVLFVVTVTLTKRE